MLFRVSKTTTTKFEISYSLLCFNRLQPYFTLLCILIAIIFFFILPEWKAYFTKLQVPQKLSNFNVTLGNFSLSAWRNFLGIFLRKIKLSNLVSVVPVIYSDNTICLLYSQVNPLLNWFNYSVIWLTLYAVIFILLSKYYKLIFLFFHCFYKMLHIC